MSTSLLMSDADLLSRLRTGDDDAFAEFVCHYSGRMLRVAQRFLRNEDDAADAVQDAFLAAFKSLARFAGNSSLATWLHRIVVNACLMKLRSRARRPVCSIEQWLPGEGTDPRVQPVCPHSEAGLARLAQDEIKAHLWSCIDRLPEDYRTVLVLRDIDELDTRQTAEILGVNPGVVKTRLHRARLALRTLLIPLMSDSSICA